MPIREVTDSFQLESIVPYFQPIVDLENARVWRYECLARLVTPSEKTFLPNEFLSLIERNNYAQQLTETIFCQSAKYFENMNIPWNINLNAADLVNLELTNTLIAHLANYPNPSRVSVEVSAKTAMQDSNQLNAFIERSLHSGLGVFIDNVGKTPGNIKNLMSLPIRGVKLAGGMIKQLDSHPEVKEFVLHVCELAQARSISVVAEHIEDEATLDKVRQLPIRYAQGFVFSKPRPAPTPH
ncbi:EAL domain-containing protein [Alteromonas pelagimontana]|uniref:EAL domain-containing protein n=1 Tax=Alteromonas pelagimontana TaxID=1858656 RepID=A0A6M4MEA3_9ALTE|nr:EAL domain-containing protein [Alteromonas pelagimontana]QJR81432.1 EAL domain-containing protein [Alteromonas pelagimontana]